MNPTTTGAANATVAALVREIAASHRDQRGALLPILHAVQAALGCVPPEAIPVLADELNLSRADVHGVVTFYHDFRTSPPAAPPSGSAGPRPASRSAPTTGRLTCRSGYGVSTSARPRPDGSLTARPGLLPRQLRARPGGRRSTAGSTAGSTRLACR